MVYKIPPGGEVNHIQPVAYKQYWFGSPVKISKQGLSAGLIINSVLLVGRWWPAFPLSSLEIKGQELADTHLQNILGPHMNIQLLIETDRWTYQ